MVQQFPKPPRPLDEPLESDGIDRGHEAFFPNFLLKEWIVGGVILLALVLWVLFNPMTLGQQADPTDTSFIPMPDWYFYFLYQILKYFPGNDIIIGVVGVPTISLLLLIFLPWIDFSPSRKPRDRIIATVAMVLVMLLVIWLTNEAHVQHLAELAGVKGATT